MPDGWDELLEETREGVLNAGRGAGVQKTEVRESFEAQLRLPRGCGGPSSHQRGLRCPTDA